MAPKKRALSRSNSNVRPPNNSKQQKRDQAEDDGENQEDVASEKVPDAGLDDEHTQKHKKMENKKPEDYVCVPQPPWDCDLEEPDSDEDEDEEAGEDRESLAKLDADNKRVFLKAAQEQSDWKWIMMWKSWQMLTDFTVREKYTIPDLFDMYIYNDWHAYGVIELVENALLEFNTELNKHKNSEDPPFGLWAPITMLARWLNGNCLDDLMMVDDGDRVWHLVGLIGCAVLTALHAVDRCNELKQESKWSEGQNEHEVIEGDEGWRENLMAYARKGGLDVGTYLEVNGCRLDADVLDKLRDVPALQGSNTADPWKWAKALKEYKSMYATNNGKIGGQQFDITKMSSAQRKKHNFDHKDPLAGFSAEDLKNNRLDLA